MWRLVFLVAAVAAESLPFDDNLLFSEKTTTPQPGSTGPAKNSGQECIDLVDFCEELKPICIGTIIVDQLQQLQSITEEISKSAVLPALQSVFPKDVEGSGDGSAEMGSTDTLGNIDTKVIENSLPLIKESLPLIRESLPLIRESLPLIRQFLDPVYYSGDASTCQKKVTCKSCRECPKLRDAVTTLVESICPATCRVCGKNSNGPDAASNLVKFYM